MIDDAASLLGGLRDRLVEQARRENAVQHPGIIGEMYEEATAKLLRNGAAFEGLGLRVATGFVEDPEGNRSRQVDCMVCVGEGRPIAQTRHRVYRAEDVLMVVEVKKTLRSKELRDALSWFRDLCFRLSWNGPSRLPRLLEKSWSNLTATPFPEGRAALAEYGSFERLVFGLLAREARLPARVLFAFDGYEGEAALATAVGGAMEKLGSVPDVVGGEITAFPNLVVCGRAGVVKLDGFPYPGTFDEESRMWAWLGSNSGNPFLSLLEVLWTRLRARFGLSSRIFGDDLGAETVTWFATLEAVDESSNTFGLRFHARRRDGETRQSGESWRPAELTEAEFQVMTGMSLGLTPDFDSAEFGAFLSKLGTSEEELVRSLRTKGVAGVSGRTLVPLIDGLRCVAMPDGTYLAGDDSTGRLTAYLARMDEA